MKKGLVLQAIGCVRQRQGQAVGQARRRGRGKGGRGEGYIRVRHRAESLLMVNSLHDLWRKISRHTAKSVV